MAVLSTPSVHCATLQLAFTTHVIDNSEKYTHSRTTSTSCLPPKMAPVRWDNNATLQELHSCSNNRTHNWPPSASSIYHLLDPPRLEPICEICLYDNQREQEFLCEKRTASIDRSTIPIKGPEALPAKKADTSLDWIRYAGTYDDGRNKCIQWKCLWEESEESVMCYYSGKKQLVRRHIETVHLKKRNFYCDYCERSFAQRNNLDVHLLARHTIYSNLKTCKECGMTSPDPAKIHRHKIQKHGYRPKHITRKRDSRQPLPDKDRIKLASL